MRSIMGMVLAGGILVGIAGESRAQFGPSMGYGYGYPSYSSYSNITTNSTIGYPAFRPGYSNLNGVYGSPYGYNNYSTSAYVAGPGTFTYSSGYRGYAAPTATYRVQPYYGAYGYGYSSYGPAAGYRPVRGVGRLFRY